VRGVCAVRVLEEGSSLYSGSFGPFASRGLRKWKDGNPILTVGIVVP
jgi:hypothetical protein